MTAPKADKGKTAIIQVRLPVTLIVAMKQRALTLGTSLAGVIAAQERTIANAKREARRMAKGVTREDRRKATPEKRKAANLKRKARAARAAVLATVQAEAAQ